MIYVCAQALWLELYVWLSEKVIAGHSWLAHVTFLCVNEHNSPAWDSLMLFEAFCCEPCAVRTQVGHVQCLVCTHLAEGLTPMLT